MQIAILKCKKDVILEGGPIKDPNFAKVGDIVIGAYDAKNNEVFALVEGKYVNVIELNHSTGYEHYDLTTVIDEELFETMRKLYDDIVKYS